ncbi:beta-N-acetylglucosaminidase [Pedobacter changchengzhani]|uniref:Beta-N-acetylglucosaminidase n=1 Tax=Pedobacter changchengzhani TaxID=2529274 RepID=A0A4R5MI38_9SPHI|nr:serine hydrolase [Pedobacter changchengzhani]TDG35212.1 beta-N-acetylglucosaminidase [Pedobacter changchengzhani]
MKRNNFLVLATASILTAMCLVACAQEHGQNEKKLSISNSIAKNTVLLNNESEFIPIKGLDKKNIASVSLGFNYSSVFDSIANKYAKIASFSANSYKDSTNLNSLQDDLKYFNTIIISIDDEGNNDAKYLNFIKSISKNKNVIVAYFGKGAGLNAFDDLKSPILFTPQNNNDAAMMMPQYIFGGVASINKLSAGYSEKYTEGLGFKTEVTRLKFTVPEDAGVNSNSLEDIDKIAREAINQKATPGLVVLVAKDGKVIFNKGYGTHTYDTSAPDRVNDIFDLASITKITATTPAVMRLYEENKLKLDTNIGAYIAKARTTPMNNIQIREVMLHQAGFIPYIPFHDYVKTGDYSRDSSANFPTKVADNYYIKKGFFSDFMWPKMLNSPIKTRGKYVYSDISMYVMKDIVEHISGEPLNKYVLGNFYSPLGMQTAGYLPRNRFPADKIIPTEDDKVFRKTLLVGYVHDQGAALSGGVAGHAGLFASSTDLAIYCQMLLNKGSYGGEQYFKPQTVEMFTAKQSDVSRRGLGFDRWDPDAAKHYPSELASPQTYGHTGYTGTAVWVDPSRGLVYIFLSNRVNPNVSNKLSTLKIRGRIQDVINRAIDEGKK